LYEFFRAKFGDAEAKNLVKLVQIETEEKFVHAKHIFATKENLKETKQELIRWLLSLTSASLILLGGISYHFDKRFEAMDKRFEAVDKRFEDFNKRFEEQTASFNKRFEEQNANFNQRFEEQNANFNQRFESIERRMDKMENKLDLILEKLNSRK
jgi:hypothetical protein